MDHPTILVLASSAEPMECAIGDIIQSRIGGSLVFVDAQRKAPGQQKEHTRVRPDRLDQLYCLLASAREASTVAVSSECVSAVLAFLTEFPGTADDFTSIICTATPHSDSQQAAIETLTRLSRIGASSSKLGLLFTQAPHEIPVDEAFSQLASSLKSGQFPNASLEAVLHQSSAFGRALDLRLPVSGILNGLADFEAALQEARNTDAPDHTLHLLARQVLAQRALHGCRPAITRALDALRLPCLSREESAGKVVVFPASTHPQPTREEDGIEASTEDRTDHALSPR